MKRKTLPCLWKFLNILKSYAAAGTLPLALFAITRASIGMSVVSEYPPPESGWPDTCFTFAFIFCVLAISNMVRQIARSLWKTYFARYFQAPGSTKTSQRKICSISTNF
jgi:hypothetical protein